MQEDFQAMTYGFKMANNVTDLRVTGMKTSSHNWVRLNINLQPKA